MLTHIDENNNPTIVDINNKAVSKREALAKGSIFLGEQAFKACLENTNKKGPVIECAVIAGIMACKNTSQAIPMCHPINITNVKINITPNKQDLSLNVESKVTCEGKTGVEMEALHATSIALLTIYDMLKAVSKDMVIKEIYLESKSGGKSKDYKRVQA